MSENKYHLEGLFSISDNEKKKEMNELILEILRKTGIVRLTTKKINGSTLTVTTEVIVDKKGIIKFDYSLFEKKQRKGNYYDTNTCELVTPDRDYNHFGFAMNLIMAVLEAYSETPCYFMLENKLADVSSLAQIIEELTGKVLSFERRARAFDTVSYFIKTEKYKDFIYKLGYFPFNNCSTDKGQMIFTLCMLNEPIVPDDEETRLGKKRQMAFSCMSMLKEKASLKEEAFEYITKLLDMTLEERKLEAKRKHSLDFIGSVAEFLPGAYLVYIYAQAFDLDFYELWKKIGKESYWDVTNPLAFEKDHHDSFNEHLLYKIYQMKNEDDFIGIWSRSDIILSKTMQANLADYKRRYFEIGDNGVSEYDTITTLLSCIEDLQSIWDEEKYPKKAMLEEFVKNKGDIRYQKAIYVLRNLIDEEMEMFSELTEEQIRRWILSNANLEKCADKHWYYIDILSNPVRRKELLDF